MGCNEIGQTTIIGMLNYTQVIMNFTASCLLDGKLVGKEAMLSWSSRRKETCEGKGERRMAVVL